MLGNYLVASRVVLSSIELVSYHAVVIYVVFSLWLCWFVDFYLVQCMAVLNVFVCVAAPYLVVSHCGYA
jgi:hypothetical protein